MKNTVTLKNLFLDENNNVITIKKLESKFNELKIFFMMYECEVVMSKRPGQIKNIQEIDLGTPRLRIGQVFTKYKEIIYKEFFTEKQVPFAYSI